MDTSFGKQENVEDENTKKPFQANPRFFCDEVVTWESLLAEITNGDHDPVQQLFVYNLIPFPFCITKEGSVRKMGVSVGPKKFIECFDRMKFAPLINSQNILAEDSIKVHVCSHFLKNGGDMQEDDMIFSLENFSQQLS